MAFSSTGPAVSRASPPHEFTRFPDLPAELRIRIWRFSFAPRVLELHSRRSHYARAEVGQWQSSCGNPVGFSVCAESRAEARSFYPIALPVYGGDDRVLYLNPATDTLVVLGELEYPRLSRLFATIQSQDPTEQGLQRIGLSVACWAHEFAGATLKIWARSLFKQLEQFILLMYMERLPPTDFRGGECVLEDCKGMESFMRYVSDAREFRSGNNWMTVGKAELRVMNLHFVSNPALAPS